MCPATLPRSADTFERHARHVDPTFVRLLGVLGYGRVFTRAEDVWLWDAEGRRYLDLVAGYGTMNLGHNHPALLAEISEFLRSAPPNVCHVGVTPWAGALAERLGRLAGAPLQIAVLTSSGAEAVEAGLKLARLATGRAEIVFAAGAFHGLTAGTLSVMGDTRLRRRLEPLLPGCHEVPFGDLPALERALSRRRAAAFVVEPVQCEGGIVLPPPGYLAAARELCERTGALLVLDEVQTGLGRTGRTFAFQDEGVVPDVLVLAKALGGGLVACGAALTSAEVFERASGTSAGTGCSPRRSEATPSRASPPSRRSTSSRPRGSRAARRPAARGWSRRSARASPAILSSATFAGAASWSASSSARRTPGS